jgi:hypothetical protein
MSELTHTGIAFIFYITVEPVTDAVISILEITADKSKNEKNQF